MTILHLRVIDSQYGRRKSESMEFQIFSKFTFIAEMVFGAVFNNSCFSHPKRFSMAFRSGLWEGHGISIGIFPCRKSCTFFDLCLGSLSITKRHWSRWNTSAWTNKFDFNMCRNISEFMLSVKIYSGKVPIDEKAAHTLILGVCFVVGAKRFFPDFVHILILPRDNQIDISSRNIVCIHNFFGYMYFLAQTMRYKRFFSLNIGVLSGYFLEYSRSLNARQTVEKEALTPGWEARFLEDK